ncbi:hypothetical protein [Actinocrispum sp. NPDC049592]|uniref:hypothetical protein n=1 Tax=Actinocrispum sp. NPDC049592 TaxID=3154835 RepID=UPI00343763DA
MKRAQVRRAVLALAVAATVAGCDAPAAHPAAQVAQTTTPSAGPAAVEWADKLCSVILDYDGSTPKADIDSSNPATMISSLNTYLDAVLTRVDTATSKLGEIGAAPVDGGDEAVRNLVQGLKDVQTVVTRSKEKLAKADPNDRSNTSATLQDVARDLQQLKTPVNPLEGMGARFPDLQAAVRGADNCTEITRARASRSALPPLTSSTEPGLPGGTTTPTTPTTDPSFPDGPPTSTSTSTP